ncbi:MAG: PEGA domain-containing protein [Prevotella sp.]|nr:PEGA domain-containing protein [Prevotella sp.]
MKRFLLSIAVSLAFTTGVVAQGLKVVDFKLLETDLTANTHGTSKQDQNGETAALIKIVTPERGFTFDGGSLGIVATEEHAGEIWLYVPRRAQKLIIRHQTFGVLRDFFYPIPIEGARTYEMLIDIGTGRYATITTQVAKANVYIDGENCGEAPLYNKYLNYGKHTIRAIKDRYEGQEEVVLTTSEEDNKTMFVNVNMRDMSDHFGNVNVTVENQADIWFEGRNVGTGYWQTQLREGTYVVETRKVDCDPEKTSFTVVAQRDNNIKAAPPSPHTGILSLYTRPRDVSAISNGSTPIDLSEAHTLPIGTYQLALSRKGYVSKNVEYTVNHNETTRDTITLDRVKYIKPNAFYFGAGYSIRQMGGITALAGAVYNNIDLEVSYTFGLSNSSDIPWYSTDGNDTYLSTMNYKRSTLAFKLGYQMELDTHLGITPQLGYEMERLSGTVTDGTNTYGDGSTANCISIGAKLLYAPIQNLYLFATPAFSIGMSKDSNFERLVDNSDITAGGFMMTIGAIFNF